MSPNENGATQQKARTGAGQRPRARRAKVRELGACWDDLKIAAQKLDLDENALRARLRRAAKREGGEIVARLGMGVVGKKLGTSWRLFVPSAEAKADAT